MPYTYRNSNDGSTVAFDAPRPDLVAFPQWTLIADDADPAAVAAVNVLIAGRAAAAAEAALVQSAQAARAADEGSYLSIREFGAVGAFAATDDTAAIQAAVDAAATFGAKVYIPPGTYKIVPSSASRCAVKLTAGVRGIFGAGAASVLKVADGVGQYHSIVSNFTSASGHGATAGGIAGIELRDFTIDQNATNNPIADPSPSGPLFTGYPRFCLGVAGGSDTASVHVINVRFVDCDNLNTIFFQGRDVIINRCDLAVSANASSHDHSAIYTQNSTVNGLCSITDNVIYAPTAGNPGARTAIETHGGAQKVSGNVVRNYFKAGNLTGVSKYSNEGIHWTGNSFLSCRYGIQLWSLGTPTYTAPLSNVHIKDNLITLDPVSWTPGAVATDSRGIFLDTTATDATYTAFAFADVFIERNTFRHLSGHTGHSGDTTCHLIDWRRTSAPTSGGVDRNIVIRGNFLDSAIGSGIRYTSVAGDYIDGLIIEGNRIRNPGRGSVAAGGGLSNGYANGLMILGAVKNGRIEDNDVFDDQGVPTMNVGLYLAPSITGGAGNLVRNNRINGANSSPYLLNAAIDGGWLVDGDLATWAAPTGVVTLGSQLRALDTGLVYRQTVAPNGSTWASFTPASPIVDTFTVGGSTTWTKRAGVTKVDVICVAAGGGGGSGRRGPDGAVRCGGGGGGGGGITQVTLPASAISTGTVTVTVGAGGAGGAAITANGTNGNNGVAGGLTSFGSYVRASGGTAGSGGSASSGTGGSGNTGTTLGGNGASASGTGAVGGSAGIAAGPPGGGAGGGITAANAASAGGASVSGFAAPAGGTGGAGGAVDSTAPTAGGSVTAGLALPGGGGGGGAASRTTNAQPGANGGLYGAGAGGGGASLDGFNSGAGGNGADGICVVVSYF